MSKSSREALETLQRDFTAANQRWPGLGFAITSFNVVAAYDDNPEVTYFIDAVSRMVVAPLIGTRVILDVQPSLLLSRTAEWMCYSVFSADTWGDLPALQHFRGLALGVCRCLFANKVDSLSGCYWHDNFWPERWLAELCVLGVKHADPVLHVREHRLEQDEAGRKFRLVPGYSKPVPPGKARGALGRSRCWSDLLGGLAQSGLEVDLLEPGVFRASAYAIDRILNSDWKIVAFRRGPQPAQIRAAASYEWVCCERPDLVPKSPQRYSRRQWEYIREHGCPAYTDEKGDSLPVPDIETWKRYLRAGRHDPDRPKVEPRAGRPHGKSIVRPDQID